jgi:uncharacterized repeat protein (TIGR01451 family)
VAGHQHTRTHWIAALVWSLMVLHGSPNAAAAQTAGGVRIVNVVAGNYLDSQGKAYGATSDVASATVAAIAAEMVEPKEMAPQRPADGIQAGAVATRTFTIANDSNITDAYVITSATVSAGAVTSLTFVPTPGRSIPATAGSTVSPAVAPGGTIGVIVTVATAGVPIDTAIAVVLTARTTAAALNGPQTDSGTTWVVVAHGPELDGVAPTINPTPAQNAAAVPLEVYVNGSPTAQAQSGTVLTFQLPFTNVGDAPAFDVVVTDQIPAQLIPVPGTVSIRTTDRRSGLNLAASTETHILLDGNVLTATLPQLNPGTNVTISFQAVLARGLLPGTTIENSAQITALSIVKIVVRAAVVFVGTMNVVYDGLGGAAEPIAGASVSLVDPLTGQAAKLPTAGATPNLTNANPFVTGAAGTFGFNLPFATGPPVNYTLYVVPQAGYLRRKISVAIVTDANGLPTTTLTALDGLPLSAVGGFGLTTAAVTAPGVTGFFDNLPLFTPQMLALSITVDRSVASAGDRLVYTIRFGPGSRPLAQPAALTVALPAGVAYARATAQLDGVSTPPAGSGPDLSWPVTNLAVIRTLTFSAVVMPGATEGSTISTSARLAITAPLMPLAVGASTDVAIVGGLLSSHMIITGRVFVDRAHDGWFVRGDSGVAAVRVFLEDGESVLTDRDGRFSFPAARPGMHVLHLDASTLPRGLAPYHGFALNDPRSSVRLVHNIFDSGLMSDIQFAISDGGAR